MDKLRKWRSESGLSLEEAGALVGVSGVQWHRYETGTRAVAADKAAKLEGITGIPCHEIRPDVFPAPTIPALAS